VNAILSDVHGNLEAFTAVLNDIKRRDIKCIYNLGDTLGYGPNPIECLDLARKMTLPLLGNHDAGVLETPAGFGPAAERAILWTQGQLRNVGTREEIQRRWDFLKGLQRSHRNGNTLFVHGSARSPTHEYLFPDDVYNQRKMEAIGAAFQDLCFCGHTHVPGIFIEEKKDQWYFIEGKELEGGFSVVGLKAICNVGSVGQPRDQDPRASYMVFDGEKIWLRRVPYDFESTCKKVHEVKEIDGFIGDRLRKGR